MKLIKKIAAIMFAFMMVVSMSCNVKADEGTTATTGETGTITINNAVDGQTYTIYKLLDLESYEPKKNEQGEEIGNYSYKPNKDWNNFISKAVDSAGTNYFIVDENGYARWNVNETKTAEFAQKALAYAKDPTTSISSIAHEKATSTTVKFDKLELGYYLVDSSVGALCNLNTTNPNMIIQEKNGVPSVEKTITSGGDIAADYKSNSVNIGDTISFQIKIDVKKGAKNYVLHDELSSGLTLIQNNVTKEYVHVQANDNITDTMSTSDYTFGQSQNGFTVTFKPEFLKKHENEEYTILVNYYAILNDQATIGSSGNVNKTILDYGESNKTTLSTTTTYTFGIPVFKYTGTEKTGLADAKFKLYTDAQCKDENEVKVKVKTNGTDYIVGDSDENENVMTSPATTGKFNINGLKAGTYYLKEIEAPKGYNKLANAIEIEIDNNGNIKVNKNGTLTSATQVDVENKTGTVLPSTGGAGTTMIYLVGAVLVLGSGVVLATKRRVKNK